MSRDDDARRGVAPCLSAFFIAVACVACGGAQKSTKSSGRLAPELIQREVRLHYGMFRDCYERGLARNPNLQGKVVVRFVIDLGGRITAVSVLEATEMPDRTVVDCIVAEYHKLKFPKPEGGIVSVVYPIMFSAADETSGDPASPLP